MDRLKRLARYAPWIGVALMALAFVAPHLALAQAGTLPNGFSIIPTSLNGGVHDCNCVSGAGWGCLLLVVKNIFQFVIYLGLAVCLLGIVWAGYEWVLSPISSGNREKGRAIFTNAIIGLVIVLGAYILVNTVFTVLTNSTLSAETAVFGTTSSDCLPTATNPAGTGNSSGGLSAGAGVAGCPGSLICGTGGTCQADPQLDNGTGALGQQCNSTPNCGSGLVCNNIGVCDTTATSPTAIPTSCSSTAASGGQCSEPSSGPCSPAALQNTCFAGRADQASVICSQESAGGNTSIPSGTDKLNGGTGPSYSIGLWQINLTTSQIGGLDCPSAFTGQCAGSNLVGSSHPGWCNVSIKNDSASQALYQQCLSAAQNATNNTQVACQLYGSNSTFSPWSYSANLCGVPKTAS